MVRNNTEIGFQWQISQLDKVVTQPWAKIWLINTQEAPKPLVSDDFRVTVETWVIESWAKKWSKSKNYGQERTFSVVSSITGRKQIDKKPIKILRELYWKLGAWPKEKKKE